MSIEAMKQALEALELLAKWEHPASKITTKTGHIYPHHVAANAATAIRAAIEQAEKPVAWMCADESLVHKGYSRFLRNCQGDWNIPVYTTPPAAPRQWIGLTDDEAMQTWDGIIKYAPGEVRVKDFARAIEAKLKEKNT